jgi:hypothetical protein
MSDESFGAVEYPLEAGAIEPGARLTMHAVLVHGTDAFFDEGAAQGFLQIEAGAARAASLEELQAPEQWHIAWVAAAHRADGARGYSGIATAPCWLDEGAHACYRDEEMERERREMALRGEIDVKDLTEDERRALARELVAHDPDAFDEASEALRVAFDDVNLA